MLGSEARIITVWKTQRKKSFVVLSAGFHERNIIDVLHHMRKSNDPFPTSVHLHSLESLSCFVEICDNLMYFSICFLSCHPFLSLLGSFLDCIIVVLLETFILIPHFNYQTKL